MQELTFLQRPWLSPVLVVCPHKSSNKLPGNLAVIPIRSLARVEPVDVVHQRTSSLTCTFKQSLSLRGTVLQSVS